jgi:hypothetical protein
MKMERKKEAFASGNVGSLESNMAFGAGERSRFLIKSADFSSFAYPVVIIFLAKVRAVDHRSLRHSDLPGECGGAPAGHAG